MSGNFCACAVYRETADPCFPGRAGFRNLDPSDVGWFLNPMLTVVFFLNFRDEQCFKALKGPLASLNYKQSSFDKY